MMPVQATASGHAIGMRLSRLAVAGIDHLHVLAAVDLRLLEDLLDTATSLSLLQRRACPLPVRHAMRGAVVVEHPARARAVHRRLVRRIVKPAWMTSLLREEVMVPMALAASATMTRAP